MAFRVGLDTGGTFTDYVLADDTGPQLALHKRLTTPDDPARGAVAGLLELLARDGRSIADCTMLIHGTTLVTNALVEGRGARTALLTTRGFRDVPEMGNQQRYDIHDLFLRYPVPLVPRRWRLEVDERVTRDGDALLRPDPAQVCALVHDRNRPKPADGLDGHVVADARVAAATGAEHRTSAREGPQIEVLEDHAAWSLGGLT